MKLIIALVATMMTASAYANGNKKSDSSGPQDYLCAISLGELHALVNTHPSFQGKFAPNFAGQFAGTWVDENGSEQFKIPAKSRLQIHGIELDVCPQPNGKLYGKTKLGGGFLTLGDSGESMRIHDTSVALKMVQGKYFRAGTSTALKAKKKKQESSSSWGMPF